MSLGRDKISSPNSMLNTFVVILSGGGLSALFFALGTAGYLALMTIHFAPFPLFVIGLSIGFNACMIAGVIAFLLLVLLSDWITTISYLLFYGLPTMILVRQALLIKKRPDNSITWYPFGKLLETLMCFSLIWIVFGWLSTLENGFQATVTSFIQSFIQTYSQHIPFLVEDASLDYVELVSFFPGMVVLFWSCLLLVNGILAQAILTRFHYNIRPGGLRLSELELSSWSAFMFLIACTLSWLSSGDVAYIAQNMAFVSAFVLFLTGLSVIHTIISDTQNSLLYFIIFYLFLLISVWLIVFVVVLGIAEQGFRIRKYLHTPNHTPQN